MSKYFSLMQYLQKSGKSSEFLTFAEIEKILGDSLPPAASIHRAWWGNHINNHQAKSWMKAGWRVDTVMLGQNVTFKRVATVPAKGVTAPQTEGLSEDEIKRSIKAYLDKNNWTSNIAWERKPGIDIDAKRNGERWIIEVKGHGSRPAMRVNYFLAVLGELLQRMDDSNAKYSIALPDLPQFRNLWLKLPRLAKQKTGVSCLFVDSNGNMKEERW
jgi:hypothetical protein